MYCPYYESPNGLYGLPVSDCSKCMKRRLCEELIILGAKLIFKLSKNQKNLKNDKKTVTIE